jgi:hypothetical protein
VAIGAVSAVFAVYDAWKVVTIAAGQFAGSIAGTDFLNLYAGARLLLIEPADTYHLDVQQSLQRSLTGRESPLVPFYLPPYAAVLVAWLGWFAYPVAYLVWLVVGIGCLTLAAYWLAPRWTRWYPLVWLALSMLYLPGLLGLAQGQTAPLALLSTTAFALGILRKPHADGLLGLGLLGLALKPQFVPVFACAAIIARRWRALAIAAVAIGVLSAVGVLRLGADGRAAYSLVSSQKLVETLTADPTFLIGPTLLHASHWFLGVSAGADLIAAVLALFALAVAGFMWRTGPRSDDALLLQLAVLPIVSIVVAPYALIYELTTWLVTFWLLWRYTETRSGARAGLVWFTSGVWVLGDLGVAVPRAGGADVAAIVGLAVVGYVGWLYRDHPRCESSGVPALLTRAA